MKETDFGRLVEEQLASSLLSPREKCLMPLLFGESPTDADMRLLTDGLDLDTENQNYLLMLARLGFARGWDKFPPEIIPRLKGVHHYHQVHNTMGFSGLAQQIRILADAGIPVMLIKGLAVRVHYAPNAPRIMWDYDIAVPEERFEEAVSLLCRTSGPTMECPHSVTVKTGDVELDLHRWIFKTNGERESDIWERAIWTTFCGSKVCVLSPEDMFIHLLDTQSRNVFHNEAPNRRMQWLCDCQSVMRFMEGLDLTALAARAQEFHAELRVRMMLKLFSRCFPNLVAEDAVDRAFPPTKKYYQMLAKGETYRIRMSEYRSRYPDRLLDSMTAAHIVDSMRMSVVNYWYLRQELGENINNMGFVRYLKEVQYVDGFRALKDRYHLRVSINGHQLKEW